MAVNRRPSALPEGFITPDAITSHSFATNRGRYQPDEVDAFLAVVAQHYAALADLATRRGPDDPYERLGDEVAGLLRAAHQEADAIRSRAEDRMAAALEGARLAHEEAARILAGGKPAGDPVQVLMAPKAPPEPDGPFGLGPLSWGQVEADGPSPVAGSATLS